MEAFPSYERIHKDTSAAINTIRKCVDNLKREGYVNTRREGKKIIYKFNNQKQFEPFSLEFLDNPNLTFTEKSYIVASSQYMYKDNKSEEGRISYTNKELSQLIHMATGTISKCNRSLQEKGYLQDSTALTKKFNLRELDLLFIWKFKEQDERISENERQIKDLQDKIKVLQEKLEKETKKKIYTL